MGSENFHPNWASPPGATIAALLGAKGISISLFMESVNLNKADATRLLEGEIPITESLAQRLSSVLGSSSHFWLERQRQFQTSRAEAEEKAPELAEWLATFPLKAMIERGWVARAASRDQQPSELLDFFDVSSLEEWRAHYLSLLSKTQFRSSASYANNVAATTAWIRRGQIEAEGMICGPFDRNTFRKSLPEIKKLTTEADPESFIPVLKAICASCGVAVVVERCPPGCAASGATCMLEGSRALLLLSGRFLSDDQFWFSFFHEAGHILLHGNEAFIEDNDTATSDKEIEANRFAESLILEPEGQEALERLPLNKFAIYRFARHCGVSPGLIVGQLQHRKRISRTSYGAFKARYKASSFIP